MITRRSNVFPRVTGAVVSAGLCCVLVGCSSSSTAKTAPTVTSAEPSPAAVTAESPATDTSGPPATDTSGPPATDTFGPDTSTGSSDTVVRPPTPDFVTQMCAKAPQALAAIDAGYAAVASQPTPEIRYQNNTGDVGFGCLVSAPNETAPTVLWSLFVQAHNQERDLFARLAAYCVDGPAAVSPGINPQFCTLPAAEDYPVDLVIAADIGDQVITAQFRSTDASQVPTEDQMVAALNLVSGG